MVTAVGVAAAVVLSALVLRLVARSRLRVKYATLWLAISVGTLLFSVFPGLLTRTASALGFAVPANLLFFLGLVVLVLLGLHLSVAVTRLENHVQRLAEEIVLLRDAPPGGEGRR